MIENLENSNEENIDIEKELIGNLDKNKHSNKQEEKKHNENTSNYVKQSFDKLIYLCNNQEYQKIYLNEIENINNCNNDIVNIDNDIQMIGHKVLKPKRKKHSKTNISEDLFCDEVCKDKFLKVIKKLKNNQSKNENYDKKIIEIIQYLFLKKNDSEKIEKIYNILKND